MTYEDSVYNINLKPYTIVFMIKKQNKNNWFRFFLNPNQGFTGQVIAYPVATPEVKQI